MSISSSMLLNLSEDDRKRFQPFLDNGFHISFPYNHDPEFIQKTSPYFKYIGEVFCALHPQVFPSVRIWDKNVTADAYLETICNLAAELKKHNIWLNVALNCGTRTDIAVKPILDCLAALLDVGLIKVTVSDLYWGKLIKNHFPQIGLGPSVNSNVESQATAYTWREWAGATFIVVGNNINKRLKRIEQIKRLGVEIKVVVNDKCIPECQMLMRHIALVGNQNKSWRDEPETMHSSVPCLELRHMLPPWHWIKKEVLPFSLPHYKGIVDSIKITDRRASSEDNIATMRNYLAMESDVHPVLGYRETEEAFERVTKCDWNCVDCQWGAKNIEIIHKRSDYYKQELIDAERLNNVASPREYDLDFKKRRSWESVKETSKVDKPEVPSVKTVNSQVEQPENSAKLESGYVNPEHSKECAELDSVEPNMHENRIECPENLSGIESLRWWQDRLAGDLGSRHIADALMDMMNILGDMIRDPKKCGLELKRIFQTEEGDIAVSFCNSKQKVVLYMDDVKDLQSEHDANLGIVKFHHFTNADESTLNLVKNYLQQAL